MASDLINAEAQVAIEIALAGLGLAFDPFEHLEASSDPHLSDYIVHHRTFAIAWSNAPALIFAPAGGGKTTMRVYATLSCWRGLGGRHPFPINYLISDHLTAAALTDPNTHLRSLARAGARALLIGLAFRPELFLELQPAKQRAIATLLQGVQIGSIAHYLKVLRTSRSLDVLSQLLDRTYARVSPPGDLALNEFCTTLEALLPEQSASQPAPRAWFDQLTSILLEVLPFQSIFVLVDGLDALPETGTDPIVAAQSIAWMVGQAPAWAEQQIFLKGFLPEDTHNPLVDRLPTAMESIRQSQIEWTPERLAEVIRKRILVASNGQFNSLDAVCSQDLYDVDQRLASVAKRLPREIILLARRVLIAYAARTQGSGGWIEAEDIDTAIAWYRAQQSPGQRPRG
jgi:hypothetical protein